MLTMSAGRDEMLRCREDVDDVEMLLGHEAARNIDGLGHHTVYDSLVQATKTSVSVRLPNRAIGDSP